MADYDVIVLGGGPGGYLAAERLGHAGKRVLLIERDALGGTCLNVGCIPTKSLLNSAKLYLQAGHGAPFGVTADNVRLDWSRAQDWMNQVVQTLVGGVRTALRRAGVEVANAHGTLLGAGLVEVDGRRISAGHVILATGSVPVLPPIPGVRDNPAVLDSTGLLTVSSIPDRLVIIGGGVIGIEFASLFAAIGTQVDVIEQLDEIAPFLDRELAGLLRTSIEGVRFHLGCTVTEIERTSPKTTTVVHTTATGETVRTEADAILLAVGRRPRVDGWGAQQAGLDVGPRGVVVDDTMRTNLPGVWAVGDVTGRSQLAHAAYRMAEIAVAHILDTTTAARTGQRYRNDTVPWAVYAMPEVAGVGLSEANAVDRGLDVVTATVPLLLSGRFIAEHGVQAAGAVKLVAERKSRVVRGIHLLGPSSPEIIWGAAAILESEYTVDDLRQLVFPHPSISEGIREAAWAVPNSKPVANEPERNA